VTGQPRHDFDRLGLDDELAVLGPETLGDEPRVG
jgi:hypothetical protein